MGIFGGGIEKNETPLQAIKRETFEELEIKLKNPKLVHEEHVKTKEGNRSNYYFVEELKDKSKIKLHEGQGMKWIYPKEIEKLKSKPYIKKAIKIIWNKLFKAN